MTLHEASRRGEAEVIRDLVHEGAEIEARDDEGRTPLLLATEAGHAAAVRALIEAGADVNAPAHPPGDDSDEPPAEPILPVVCRCGLFDRIWPILGGRLTVRVRRMGNPDGPSPLMTAAAVGQAEIVASLLDAGADVNRTDRDGFTALAYAAAFGHDEIVRSLIRSGADLNPVDHHGMRPVGIAALLGQTGAVQALADAGADLTAAANDSYSPLQAAARYGHLEATRVLLAANAEPNAKILGETPLALALREGHAEVVALLAAGAGGDDVSAAYLKAREFSHAARSPEFQARARAFAAHYGLDSKPLLPRRGRRSPCWALAPDSEEGPISVPPLPRGDSGG